MVREEIGLQPRSKVILRHAQHYFERYLQKFFFSLHFSLARENLCYQGTCRTCQACQERYIEKLPVISLHENKNTKIKHCHHRDRAPSICKSRPLFYSKITWNVQKWVNTYSRIPPYCLTPAILKQTSLHLSLDSIAQRNYLSSAKFYELSHL